MMEWNHFIALLIGLTGSTVVHLSHGLMRLGIFRRSSSSTGFKSNQVYLFGLILNFTAPLWVILANRFGPTILYTSVYAVGLIPLLVFSCIQFGHRIRPRELIGAVLR